MKLQTGSTRNARRLSSTLDLQTFGSLEVGHKSLGAGTSNTPTTTAYFKVPTLTTAQRNALTGEEGMVIYDTSLGVLMAYNAGGWGRTDGTAAASMDAAYNGGSSITVDTAAVTLTSSLTDAALAVVANSVTTGDAVTISATGLTNGNALKISAVEATLNTGYYLACYDGAANDFTVGKYGATVIAGAAATDVLTVTAGHVVVSSGNLTLSSGNLSVTGTGAISSTLTVSGALTCDSTAVVDVTNAAAFKVRKNGTGTTIFNIDTTGDAGDTEFTLVSETTSGIGASLTVATTTGTGLYIDGSTVTTGDALKIKIVSGTMDATGAAISVVDGSTEIFAVRDDGTVYAKGTAEGTTGLQLATGDLVVSDGDVVITAGDFEVTDSDACQMSSVNGTTTLLTLDNESGVIGSDAAVLLIDAGGAVASGGNLLRIAPTGTPNAGAIVVEVVGASKTCQMMYIDGDSTAAAVVAINGGGALTDGLGVLNLTNDGNLATGGNVLNVTMGGTPHAAAAAVEIAAVKDAYALYIASGNATNSAMYITSNGAIANDKAVVEIVGTGTPANTGSNLLRVDGTGLTATNKPTLVEVAGAGKDVIGMAIDADSVGNVVLINGGGNIANDTAVLQVTQDGATQSAGGCAIRVANSGTPNAGSIGIEGVFTSKDMIYLTMAGASATNSAAFITSTGAIADNKAVLELTATGTPAAAGSNILRVDGSGLTATNTPTLVEITGDAKDVTALDIDADPTTNHLVIMHSAALTANDKAMLYLLHENGASAAGSNIVRIVESATPNAGAIGIELQFQKDMKAIEMTTSAATNHAFGITADGAIATTKAVLYINATGTPAAATSYVASFNFTGTATNHPVILNLSGASKDCAAFTIDADPTTQSLGYMHTDGAIAADKAVLELNSEASGSNADSAILRLEQGATDGVATCLALKQDDVDIPFITFETTIGVGNGIEAVGAKTLITTHFVMVDIEGVGARYLPVGTIA